MLPARGACFGISAALQSRAEAPQPLAGHPNTSRGLAPSQGNGWTLSSVLVVPGRAAPLGTEVGVQG